MNKVCVCLCVFHVCFMCVCVCVSCVFHVHLSDEAFGGGEEDLGLHAVGHVPQQELGVRGFVTHPQVVKEAEHTALHHRGQVLLLHVALWVHGTRGTRETCAYELGNKTRPRELWQ